MNTEPSNPTCPKCGTTIPPEAPQGLCPKCVMSGVATEAGAGMPELSADDAPSIDRVAAAFPNLDQIELIGRGGMGFVFKARQPHLDRYVALKLLPDKLAADPHFAERFNREGRVLAKLNHPNIVSVHDFGKTDQFYFLMMEYVDGVNLRQAMRAGRFSPAEALAVVPNICEALQYAHDQGVLHRDIKPENILLDTEGRAKIADFGIAKLVGEDAAANVTLTMTGSSLGTPHYMAPEQLEKPADVDHRADIYSLGVVLYELLTGELPIGRFDAPSSKTPVGKGVDDVVFRALEKNREKRQHSATEFKTQVQTAGTIEPQQKPASSQKSEPKVCGATAAGTLLVGLSLVNIVVGLFIHFLMHVPVGSVNFFFPVVVPFLAMSIMGTVLGWVGLVKIKRSAGEFYGRPIALFSALTYPIGLPALVIIAFPMLIKFQAGAGPGWIARITILALIAGSLSALIWGAVAIGRWAYNRPRGEHWNARGWAVWTLVFFLPMFLITLSNLGGREKRSMTSGRSPDPIVARINAAERLPAGVVELVALSTHPSDGTWWKPDGSPWTEAPFTNPGHSASSRAPHRAVEMVFRMPGVTDSNPVYKFKLEGATGTSGGSMALQGGDPVDKSYFIASTFPRNLFSTTVSVGVAHGDWETLADEKAESQASLLLTRRGEPISIKFVDVVEDNAGGTVLTVAHDIKNAQVWLVAVDHDGNEFPNMKATTSKGHVTATFPNHSLDSIARFRLKVRWYRWVVFEDVQLAPRTIHSGNPERPGPYVRVDFSDVKLAKRDGVFRLDIQYTSDVHGAELSWNSDGEFRGAPIDISQSTRIRAGVQADSPYAELHTVSFALPADMDSRDVGDALNQARDRWKGNSLHVHPGDETPIVTVSQPPGNEVALVLAGRSAKEE